MADEKKFVKEITPQSEDFSRWYIDVIRKGDLMDYTPSAVASCSSRTVLSCGSGSVRRWIGGSRRRAIGMPIFRC